MALGTLALDDDELAVLDQVLLGLAPVGALTPAAVYTDTEGTPVARRDGDSLTALQPRPWPDPRQTPRDRAVVVAVDEAVPATGATVGDAVVVLPLGGTRADEARRAEWARRWRASGARVVDAPVRPEDAAGLAGMLASAYGNGELRSIETVPLPPGRGRVLFLTGLSGSGKSTIARAVVDALAVRRSVTLLDGDVVRTHLSRGLGFSREDRDTNIRRIGWVAAEVAKHGGVAVCAPIAPYDDTRRWVRATVQRAAGPQAFVLVWVATPLAVCEVRDPKGLYARARAGEITGFTGVDDPYEEPLDADLVLDTSTTSLDDAVRRVVALVP